MQKSNNFNSGTINVRLSGGLGNNLFQYSAGMYLSKRLKRPLTFQKSSMLRTEHDFEILVDFNSSDTRSKTILPKYVTFILSIPLLEKIMFKLARLSKLVQTILFHLFRIYFSNQVGYDTNLEKIEDSVTLVGYFQSWKYASCLVESEVLDTIFVERSNWFEITKTQMQFVKPVVIHIRRGDYTKNIETLGLLSKVYYYNALNSLPTELSEREIWIFSDEIEKAKNVLAGNNKYKFHFVDTPEYVSALEVMYLMSFGVAHIIANSSFSYWAAMLSKNSRVIIAPTKWFKNTPDPIDLLPKNWVKVASSWES